VPGFKAAKNRLNSLLLRNAVAVHHLKPHLLYHSANFSEFKDVSRFNLSVLFLVISKGLD
jgi:hypothetical protein